MSKIVVLGADGFIGKNLVEALADNSSNHIVAFDRFKNFAITSHHPFSKISNVSVVPGNFFNRDDMHTILRGADYVFHLISTTTPATSANDPYIDIDTNIRQTVELLEICVNKGVRRVIFPSSGGTVYGNIDDDMISELTAPQPKSPYGIGKVTIEHYLRYFKHTHGLDYIVYRIANPYGHGQNIYGKQGVIPIFMHHFLRHKPITVLGDGTMMRDYLYVDDLINMVVSTYNLPAQHSEYNIGSGRGVSINQLVAVIEKVVGFSVPIEHQVMPATYVQKSVLDIRRFVNEFGIEPSVGLEEGIKRTWDYVKSFE